MFDRFSENSWLWELQTVPYRCMKGPRWRRWENAIHFVIFDLCVSHGIAVMYHNEADVNDNYDDDDKVFIFSHNKGQGKGCWVVEKALYPWCDNFAVA